MLAADTYFKYKKIRDWRMFAKKHWPDLLMMALIPFISTLKGMSLSTKIFKGLKMTKSGVKFAHKTKKMRKDAN